MKKLLDILACPICKTPLERVGDELICLHANHHFPIVNGVPILLPDWEKGYSVEHEAQLVLRSGYDFWVHRNVLQSLTGSQIVVDLGAGNMRLDDPCIIRMDITLTPYVDIVADAHALPFQDNSVDYIFSLAVLEHLRQPFVAAQEMYRALRPGGYVYADTNFVFAYHGYPHHYFNFSLHGIEQVFAAFVKLASGVPPYQMPSYALESVLGTYVREFTSALACGTPDAQELELVHHIYSILALPLHSYNARFSQDTAYRVSAGVFFLGFKQTAPGDTIIPKAVMDVYLQDKKLASRYPNPNDLSHLDNLMTWAKREGYLRSAAIAECLESVSFSKYWDDRPLKREWIESLPLTEAPALPTALPAQGAMLSQPSIAPPTRWWQLPAKALEVLIKKGPRSMVVSVGQYLRWLAFKFWGITIHRVAP